MLHERIGDGIDLYLGDCREILPTLGQVDATVTDPPYGISYKPSARKAFTTPVWGTGEVRDAEWSPIEGDDRPFDPTEFLLGKEQIFFGANYFYERLPAGGSWLIWDKKCGKFEDWTGADCDMIWHSKNAGAPRMHRQLWMGTVRDGHRTRDQKTNPPSNHPTEKPVLLLTRLIERLAPDLRVILDPFMGSGPTGIAAVQLGRHFIGIEKELKYFDIARARVDSVARQSNMFEALSLPNGEQK